MKKRNFGLDIVRSLAIFLVLITHISPFLKNHVVIFNVLYNAGFFGVELFFVLSGFLIGQILIKRVLPKRTFKEIKTFYLRRWLRTLPVYFLVLTFLIIISNLGQNTNNLHLLHFIFLQNFHPTEQAFFGVAWSLSVEEWFYLLTPLTLFLIPKKSSAKNISIYVISAIIVILLVRWIYVLKLNPSFDFGVRKFIPLRFDSLLVGVLLANIYLNHSKLYKKISSYKLVIITISALSLYYGIALYIIIFGDSSFFDKALFPRVFAWVLISLLFAQFISFFENNKFINLNLKRNKFLHVLFTRMSLYSYSLYLIHYDIYAYFQKNLNLNNTFENFAKIIISTIVVVCLSSLLYNYVENPILKARDKFIH